MRESVGRSTATTSTLGWSRILATLEGRLDSATDETLKHDYIEVFGHTVSTDCPPYESEYGQAHVFQKSQTLADLTTFYDAFGAGINPELRERPGHLSVGMEFIHLLTFKEAYAQHHGHGEEKERLCKKAQISFLAVHLDGWVNTFVERLARKSGHSDIYTSLAVILRTFMDTEFDSHSIDARPPGLMSEDAVCQGRSESVPAGRSKTVPRNAAV